MPICNVRFEDLVAAKLLVIACNTANAFGQIQSLYGEGDLQFAYRYCVKIIDEVFPVDQTRLF